MVRQDLEPAEAAARPDVTEDEEVVRWVPQPVEVVAVVDKEEEEAAVDKEVAFDEACAVTTEAEAAADRHGANRRVKAADTVNRREVEAVEAVVDKEAAFASAAFDEACAAAMEAEAAVDRHGANRRAVMVNTVNHQGVEAAEAAELDEEEEEEEAAAVDRRCRCLPAGPI